MGRGLGQVLFFILLGLPVQALQMASPNGRLHASFHVEDGVPQYSVSFRNHQLIRPSNLGIDFKEFGPLGKMSVRTIGHRYSNSFYQLPFGKTRTVQNRFEEYTFALVETAAPHRRVRIVFRLYDDGVAFRYVIPKQAAISNFVIRDEQTTFAIDPNVKMYALPLQFGSQYEQYYTIDSVGHFQAGQNLGLPILLEYPHGLYVGLTEAELVDYAGLYLNPSAQKSGVLLAGLAPNPNDSSIKVQSKTPARTPWRVIMVGDSMRVLLESNLISSLNKPSAIKDTSWIHPGKVQFPWWSDYYVPNPPAGVTPGLNTWTLKHYIDFCSANGILYNSLDGFMQAWYGGDIDPYGGEDVTKSIPEIDLPEVLSYAKAKGVRTRAWLHAQGLINDVERVVSAYERMGISGIMVDFVSGDDQGKVHFYNEVLQRAAAHHLTVAFHGVYKPTGLSRTYPNLLTQEAVLGSEYDKFNSTGSPPDHEVLIAFIRMMAGPLDTHQGSFRPVPPQQFDFTVSPPRAMGTLARQLAMYVVYENHMPMVADYPEAYTAKPEAFRFVQDVPMVWDETRMLQGEIGKYITMARRHGEDWYIGTITDQNSRSLSIPLGFLGDGTYVAEIYSDKADPVADPDNVVIRRVSVSSASTLELAIGPAGGNAIRISKSAY